MTRWRAMFDRLRARVLRPRPEPPPQPFPYYHRRRDREQHVPYLHSPRDSRAWQRFGLRPGPRNRW